MLRYHLSVFSYCLRSGVLKDGNTLLVIALVGHCTLFSSIGNKKKTNLREKRQHLLRLSHYLSRWIRLYVSMTLQPTSEDLVLQNVLTRRRAISCSLGWGLSCKSISYSRERLQNWLHKHLQNKLSIKPPPLDETGTIQSRIDTMPEAKNH